MLQVKRSLDTSPTVDGIWTARKRENACERFPSLKPASKNVSPAFWVRSRLPAGDCRWSYRRRRPRTKDPRRQGVATVISNPQNEITVYSRWELVRAAPSHGRLRHVRRSAGRTLVFRPEQHPRDRLRKCSPGVTAQEGGVQGSGFRPDCHGMPPCDGGERVTSPNPEPRTLVPEQLPPGIQQ